MRVNASWSPAGTRAISSRSLRFAGPGIYTSIPSADGLEFQKFGRRNRARKSPAEIEDQYFDDYVVF
jgi:hypothetical protein